MFEFAGGKGNTLVFIGSVNEPLSSRTCFSYEERRRFFNAVFSGVRVLGIPDFHNIPRWLAYLDDLIRIVGNADPREVTYFGGCPEDVRFFKDDGRKIKIINRFDGTAFQISATEVRAALAAGAPLEKYLNPLIREDVQRTFSERLE